MIQIAKAMTYNSSYSNTIVKGYDNKYFSNSSSSACVNTFNS